MSFPNVSVEKFEQLIYWMLNGASVTIDEFGALSVEEREDFVWSRINYKMPYYKDKIVVSGHTPTQAIPGNPRPGYVYRANNHISIDCGACHSDGRLAAICLESGEEFYSDC